VQLDLPFLRADPAVGPLRVEFVRMRRARRYILRVLPDGTVRVTIPRGGSRREAEEFFQAQRVWAEGERLRVQTFHAPLTWQDGEEILLRGVRAPLSRIRGPREDVVTCGDRRIRVPAGTIDLRPFVEADLRALARCELVPRLHELAAVHELHVSRVTIRNQRSRWGSCSRTGAVALNFRLVQVPPGVRDYVLIHELMHRRQPNHSRRFWRLVEAACPGFRECERWLRVEGRSLF
jgi:predicted metal-dependent hydrolase